MLSSKNAYTQSAPTPYPHHGLTLENPVAPRAEDFRVSLVDTAAVRERVYRLRYQVFNLEMGEGLAAAFATEMDRDAFDDICDHLVVEDLMTGEIVGTYRMQLGRVAAHNLGYYSEREFDLAPYASLRPQLLELGRACVHRQYRSPVVLRLLWRGVISYARERDAPYLIGCSSIPSIEAKTGSAMYHALSGFLIEERLRTRPCPAYSFPIAQRNGESPKIPKLLKAYLSLGAQICGEPAVDRDFGTIDFLTFLDLERFSMAARFRFLNRCM